jgi:N-carbamoyl-L-amino-acid hydrolase
VDRLIAEIEASRGVAFTLGGRQQAAPTPMDPGIREAIRLSAEAVGTPYRIMPSGGGHDAASFAEVGIPAAMVFVRNQNGSHTPLEAMRIEDFAAATTVIAHWAAEAARVT